MADKHVKQAEALAAGVDRDTVNRDLVAQVERFERAETDHEKQVHGRALVRMAEQLDVTVEKPKRTRRS